MDRKLLDILVCPISRQPLTPVASAALRALNQAIADGRVMRADETAQNKPLEDALMTSDGKRVYRIEDGIPVLLAEEAILTAGVSGFERT